LFTLTKRCLLFVCGLAKQNNRKPANSPIRPHRGSMHRANSQCVIGVRDLIQTGSLDTSMAASLPNSERTPFRTGVKVWFFLLALALPSAAQWRTGYYLQREAGGQTAATIPWSKYTHVIHYALRPTYSNGACGLDTTEGLLGAPNIEDFVNGAHAAGVKAIIGIRQDDTIESITACTAPQNIAEFVDRIRTFVTNTGYDGVDLDWETNVITAQFQDLVRRLRTALPTAVLSVVAGFADRFTTAAVQYDLDQINIRAYDLDSQDLTASAINYTWHPARTLKRADTQDQAMDILSWEYVYAGNASSKLGLTVPFYGRIRQGCLIGTVTNGVTNLNQDWGGRAEIGSVPYRDLVNSAYCRLGTRVWDNSRSSQYIQYRGGTCSTDAFIPYLGPEQIQAAVALIKTNEFGGVATYGLPYEYMAQQVGDGRYPLSTALYDAMIDAHAGPGTISRTQTTATPDATTSPALTRTSRIGSHKTPIFVGALPQAASASPRTATTGGTFTFYVDSVSGLDSNPGTLAMPWKTIAKVNSTKLTPGQSVAFKRGGVWREMLTPGQSGAAGAPITFTSYGSGAQPIFDGADVQSTWTPESQAAGANFTSDPNVYGYWYFDGTLNDGTARGNTLTNTGSSPFDSTIKKQGTSALALSGSTQYASIVDASLSAGFPGKTGTTNTDLTLGAWVYFHSFVNAGVVIGKAGQSLEYVIYTQLTAGTYIFHFSATLDGSQRTVMGDQVLSTGQWYHVVGRINSVTKKMELFVNGIKQAASYTATSTTLNTGPQVFAVGYSPWGTYSTAHIDEAWIFTRALSDSEISSIYSARLDGSANPGFTVYHSTTGTYTSDPGQVFQIDGEIATRLTRASLVATMPVGSWYYDAANTRVYIRTTVDDAPSNHTIEVSSRSYGVYGVSLSYVTIDGLHATEARLRGFSLGGSTSSTVQNSTADYNYDYGIAGSGSTLYTVRSNLVAYNGSSGIDQEGGSNTNFLITQNKVHHNCQLAEDDNQNYCAGIRAGSSSLGNGTISYNWVYSQSQGGKGAGNGIHMDTNPTSNSAVVIDHNTVNNNYGDGIVIEQAHNVSVTYNVAFGNSGTPVSAGIEVYRSTGPNHIYNNSLYGNALGVKSWGDGAGAHQTSNGFENNISFNNAVRSLSARYGGENDGANGSGNVYTYNSFGPEASNFIEWGDGVYMSGYLAWETAPGACGIAGCSHSVPGDPLFNNPSYGDFSLQVGSPDIGAGLYISGVSTANPPNIGAK
jgi:hypothetical protein